MKIVALTRIIHDGGEYPPGSTLDVDDALATRLIETHKAESPSTKKGDDK